MPLPATTNRLIAYYRVSTQRQGRSGLGMEAQREMVARYARAHGAKITAEYTEIETGKGLAPDRPQLKAALDHAERDGSLLVIAKLDRLARNVAFIANLLESGARFIALDIPEANTLTIHIMAAFAEAEARRISERTREALAARKRRGLPLGAENPACRNLNKKAHRLGQGSQAAWRRRQALADKEAVMLVVDLRSRGQSLSSIARTLNEIGYTTVGGAEWTHVQVSRLIRYIQEDRPDLVPLLNRK